MNQAVKVISAIGADSTERLNGELVDLIQEEIDRRLHLRVHEAVAHEEDKRFRQLKWLAVIIGIVGLGTFGTAANYLIEKAVDSRAGALKESLALNRLHVIALKLDLNDSFSSEERSAVMELLQRVAASDEMRRSPDFSSTLVQILTAFVAANQSESVNRMLALFNSELMATASAVEVLLHHYGQAISGRATAPTALGGQDDELIAFERLEAVAPGHRLEELALAYRILYEHSNNPSAISGRVWAMVDRTDGLLARDRERLFKELLTRSRATNWQNPPGPSGLEIERKVRSFFDVYGRKLADKYRVEEEIFTSVSAEGIDKRYVDVLAAQLAKAQ